MQGEFFHIRSKHQLDNLVAHLSKQDIGEFGYQVQVKTGKRSTKQNAAIHVFFKLLADELNDAGLDMKRTLKEETDIPWSPALVKEFLWKPVQDAAIGKKSTTQLDRAQVSHVYEILTRYLGQKFGVSVPFPSAR